MPLRLITGPPNSGRTDLLKEGFLEATRAGRNPVLLVPSVDDVFVWERRLTRPDDDATRSGEPTAGANSSIESPAGAFAGGRIVHFLDLCREITRAVDGTTLPVASEVQRRVILERAVRETAGIGTGPAARIDDRTERLPGLVDAALELVDEYRAERVLGRKDQRDGDEEPSQATIQLRDGIEPLVDTYSRLLEAAGLTDPPSTAQRAIEVVIGKEAPDSVWGESPLFVAGFDDMTGQQLELVRRLSNEVGVDVTMVVTWEKDNLSDSLPDRFMGRLREHIGFGGDPDPRSPDGAPGDGQDLDTPNSGLTALASAFLAGRRELACDPPPPVRLIRAAGQRKEAEAIGAEIAKLLATRAALPDQIAVAHTDPASSGRLLETVLRHYRIPTTLETETPALATTIGAGLAALIDASGRDGTADDLIMWIRGPLGPGPDRVDEIELLSRQRGLTSAAGALDLVPDDERGEWASMFDRTKSGEEKLGVIASLARASGRAVLKAATVESADGQRLPERPDSETELEVRMAEAIASSAEDLASADIDARDLPGLFLDAMRKGEVSVWTVPTQGTVRITGPWGLRAKRVRYLFVAGLQEGGTRDLTRAGPFLSTVQRDALGMLERVDPEVQARYLMFACLSVPTAGLWLSCTTSDDSGKSTAPSPLIAEIEALCGGDLEVIERSGSDVSFPPDLAPTEAELARALAVTGRESGSVETTEDVRVQVEGRLARARELEERTREFGSMEDPEVLEELGAIETFSPSEIEAWLRCPWTWFMDRRIRPASLKPDEDFLAAGSLVHTVLERLYEEALQGRRLGPETVAGWVERVPGLFDEVLEADEGNPLGGDDPFVRLARLGLEQGVIAFLEREAEEASEDFDPALLEYELDRVEMGDWKLRGRVDRVDTQAGAEPGEGVRSLVIDYKTGTVDGKFSPSGMEKNGTVQIALYMEALRRSLGIDPVAGFVLPVKDGGDSRPRGPIQKDETEVVGKRRMIRDREGTVPDVDEFMAKALTLADDAVEAIRSGRIEHPEGDCRNHFKDPLCLLPRQRQSAPPQSNPEAEPPAAEEVESDEDHDFPLSEQQKRVVESRKTEIMVSAAAGSGKTSVTVKRYMRLLAEGADPSSILVFTFTDQAAASLREKVRRVREKAGDGQGAISMSDAWVGTFHSICSRILTAYPLEADIDPTFTVIDDITASSLRTEAFERALTRRLEAAEEDGTVAERVAVLGQVSRKTLRSTVEALFDQLRSRGDEFPRLEVDPSPPPYPEKELRDLLTAIDGALDGTTPTKSFTESQKENCRALKRLIEGPRGDRLHGKEVKDLGFSNQSLAHLIELREKVEKALFACDGHPWVLEVGALLEGFGLQYAALKETRSALDFEDLQIKTLNLLETNEAVRDDYGSRFQEVMVDEFQDTNRLQMRLIDALRGTGDGRSRLMTVGDEMQAIYRFRHADVGIFRDRRSELSADPDHSDLIELPENHRSAPGILDAVNYLGERIQKVGEDDEGAPTFAKLEPGRDAGEDGPLTTLILTPKTGWDGVDLGDLAPAGAKLSDEKRSTVAEALAVASEIHDLVESGQYRQRDVALLLRVTTSLPIFEAALNQFGLRTVVPSSKGFWESRPVREIIALLSVVANPLDDEALVATLTSPAFGVGPDGLWKIRTAAGRSHPLWEGVCSLADRSVASDDDESPGDDGVNLDSIRRLRVLIETMRQGLGRRPLESVVSDLIDRTGLDLTNLLRDRSSLASMERVATLAGDYERQEGRNLRGFLDWAESSRVVDAEAAIAISGEQDDAVKIMTIHKSKGLEFPVVCVADLGRNLGGGSDVPIRIDHGGDDQAMRVGLRLPGSGTGVFEWDEVAEDAEREDQAEELRLIHVAMTRAEERLILSGVAHPFGGKAWKNPIILRILKALGIDSKETGDWAEARGGNEPWNIFGIRANLPPEEDLAPEALLESYPLILPAGPSGGQEPPLWRPERAFFPDVPLSFSGLLEFGSCPTRFFAKRVLRMDVGPGGDTWSGPETSRLTEREGGTRFGTAVHDLLEKLPTRGWEVPSEEQATEIMRAARIDGSLDQAAADARDLISGFLDSDLGRLARASGDGAIPEVPIVVGIGGLTIRGFIDLLVKAEEGVWIVDYKTNSLGDRSPQELMETYELQRDLYSLAIARAEGLETVNSAFVFLEQVDSPVVKTYRAADLDEVEQRLRREVVEPITQARYFGGGPGPQPCGTCDACALLGLAEG